LEGCGGVCFLGVVCQHWATSISWQRTRFARRRYDLSLMEFKRG
jgi:hypothetical protein